MVPRREHAIELARLADGLARATGLGLDDDLLLWSLAGGRPQGSPVPSADPAAELGRALEDQLGGDDRRMGAHYTPAALADHVAELALPVATARSRAKVVDPACGGGALLLAAGRRLASHGRSRAVVARDLLWGADVDALAVATTEASIALWSGGIAPSRGHLATFDSLLVGRSGWPDPPAQGFAAVVGNPPFQGQLSRATARSEGRRADLRARFGEAVSPYVDTAALFLLAAAELVSPGARVVMVQPTSTAASRDAGGVRSAVARQARLVDMFVPAGRTFRARVEVCVPVLEVGVPDPGPDWAGRLVEARGLPDVGPLRHRRLGSMAIGVAGFRQHYYRLVDHVHEERGGSPLVTSGLIDVGVCRWGERPARFAKRSWDRPSVDVVTLAAQDPEMGSWIEHLGRTKVLVASQSRVIEAVTDHGGAWVPCTPVVSVLPHDPEDAGLLCAALCSPPASVWAARRAAGTGLSPGAIRLTTSLVLDVPLPEDLTAWRAAATSLEAGDLDSFGTAATAMYHLPAATAAAVQRWWHEARPR